MKVAKTRQESEHDASRGQENNEPPRPERREEQLPWNLVTKHLYPHPQLRKKIQDKIAKLEKHLKHFPPGTVHLHILLEQNPKRSRHTAGLTLRLPSNILHSEKSAPNVIKAFDDAVKALLRELESLKAEFRRERFWNRRARRHDLRKARTSGFAAEPQAEGSGPETLQEIIRSFIQQHYERLLRHARRHIRHDEMSGALPVRALDPRDLVDEAARQAEAKARLKPERKNWLLWVFSLLHQELGRQRRFFRQKQAEEIPIEKTATLPEETEKALQPLETMVLKVMEPEILRTEDTVPSPEVVPPDRIVAARDLLEHLQHAIQGWPRSERELFELYFVEGFEPDEVAMIAAQPLKKVQDGLKAIQERLRDQLRHEDPSYDGKIP